MANAELVKWPGKSGSLYAYGIHILPVTFDEGQDGNYIYCKIVNNKWVPIYFGEGDLGGRSGSGHHKADCIKEKGATHFHEHLQGNKDVRKTEEEDLLENFPEAYAPTGCNEKEGG
jgi:hypothetical protein